MLPTQHTPRSANPNHLTALVEEPTRFGGCLKGDTVLIHPGTSWPTTIRDLVDRREGIVLTMRAASVLAPQRPSAYLTHEPAQLYRLLTHTGRSIETTASHPFLTPRGWKPLLEVSPGDGVAVVVEYPGIFGPGDTDVALLKLLAYLTALGTTGDGATPTITDPQVGLDVMTAVDARGDTYVELGEDGSTRLRVCGKDGARSKTVASLIAMGVHGVTDPDKLVPDFVYGLRKDKLRVYLNRRFTCDGTPEPSGRICYRAISVRMLRQVQHLLARFGIVSAIGDGPSPDDGAGAKLWIDDKVDVVRFIDQIGFFGDKALQAEFVRASLYDVRETETPRDRLGPILFDRVRSLEATEVAPVYDLTIEGSRNFVANDFVVHDSSRSSHTNVARSTAAES